MVNNALDNVGLSKESQSLIHSAETEREKKLIRLEKSIEIAFDSAFEIDVDENSVYEIFWKKGALLYNEFSKNNKMSYTRLCRLIVTEIADSLDIEAVTEFLNPSRIKSVQLDKNGKSEERLQFRVKNTSPVLWREYRIVYDRDEESSGILCTIKDITYEKNFELKYFAQSELLRATQKSELEIRERFFYAVKNTYDIISESNYTTLEHFEYDFSSDNIKKKRVRKGLAENIKYLAQNIVYPDDAQRFLDLYGVDNIIKFADNGIKTVDITLRLKPNNDVDADYEWYILTGFLSANENNEIILTVFNKNINKDETEKRKNRERLEASLVEARDALRNEEQYKNALTANSYFWISASVDKDLIEEDIIDANGNSLLKAVGLSAPCRLSEFAKRWTDRYILKGGDSILETTGFDLAVLKENYKRGKHSYKSEYEAITTTGKVLWFECYTLLIKKESTDEIMLLHYSLDITSEKKKRDNYQNALEKAFKETQRAYKNEAQYRQAVLSQASLVLSADLNRNVIACEVADKSSSDFFRSFDVNFPCRYSNYLNKTFNNKVYDISDDLCTFLSLENLFEKFRNGEKEASKEFYVINKRINKQMWLKATAVLTQDESNGHINALIYVKSIDDERKREQENKQKLIGAYEEAKRANNAKSEFLSKMSHDIRTPLNAILGMTNLAEQSMDDREKLMDCIEKIKTSSDYLLGLINDILDMSKIESGKILIKHEKIDIYSLITDVVNIVEPQAKNRNQKFIYDFSEINHKYVMGDFLRIQQVFINIIANSVKFTGTSGGCIIFKASEIKSQSQGKYCYKFVISDNGIGMKKEFLSDIFKPFVREESSTISKVEGTGLGMSITKSIIDLMNGEIYVDSEIGKGTTFTVLLHFDAAEELICNSFSAENKNSRIERKTFDFSGRRFLIVEDNQLNRKIVNGMFMLTGAVVENADDGQIAVSMFERSHPGYYDAVLMDVLMPNVDGYEASRIIRSMNRSDAKTIPIFAMTANAFEEDKKKSIEAGMDYHVSKPIDFNVMFEKLDEFIKKSKQQ